jgi:predicted aspartyl protease
MNDAGSELLLEIDICGSLHHMLIDSGASVSVIKPGIAVSEIRTTHTRTTARGITGTKLKVMGTQEVTFTAGKRTYTHEFLIAALDTEYSGILGVDVLRHMGARVDLRTSTLLLGRKAISVVRAGK